MIRRLPLAALALAATAIASLALSQETGTIDPAAADKLFPKAPYSPYAGRNFPTRPFFGDTHLHTSYSMDAGAFGCRLAPKDAYRFARGEEVTASSGQRVKLSRPLDFLVVADHSDGMGFFPQLFGGDPKMLADPQGRKWYDMIQSGQGAEAAVDIIISFGTGDDPRAMPVPGHAGVSRAPGRRRSRPPRRRTIRAASPRSSASSGPRTRRATTCTATSSSARTARKASQVEPFTTQKPLGSDNPRDLWKWMAAYEAKTGGDVLAIAHNGNLSATASCFPIIESLPARRSTANMPRRAPTGSALYEVTQIKGDGETHPFLSPNDEFANFERWDKGNLDLTVAEEAGDARVRVRALGPEERPEARGGAGRESLQVRHGRLDRRAHRARDRGRRQLLRQDVHLGAQRRPRDASLRQDRERRDDHGLGADRLRLRRRLGDRKHARGRSSTRCSARRPTPRPARAWSCASSAAGTSTRRTRTTACPRAVGYTKGVPMGGDLSNAPAGKSPTFLVAALEGSDRREPRPHPDHQRLARRQGRAAREDL